MKKTKKVKILIISIVCLSLATTLTYGKYFYNSAWDYYLQSKGFYFSSDNLNIGNQNTSNLQWDGNDILFNLKNSENNNNITKYDIRYKVTCSVLGSEVDYVECKINNTNSNIYEGVLSGYETCLNSTMDGISVSDMEKQECEIAGYSWIEEKSVSQLSFNLFLTDSTKSISNIKVEIKAESVFPYKKTLYGTYTLNKISVDEDAIVTNYENKEYFDNLLISNYSKVDKCVKINWDSSNLRIDAELEDFNAYETDNNGYINLIKIGINAKKNKLYRFYKTDDKVYSIKDFNIEEINCDS